MQVIVPLLSMQNSVLLCISTLLESGNHYSKMFELKDSVAGSCLRRFPLRWCATTASETENPTSWQSTLLHVQPAPPVALTPTVPQDAKMAVVRQNGALPCPVLVPPRLH